MLLLEAFGAKVCYVVRPFEAPLCHPHHQITATHNLLLQGWRASQRSICTLTILSLSFHTRFEPLWRLDDGGDAGVPTRSRSCPQPRRSQTRLELARSWPKVQRASSSLLYRRTKWCCRDRRPVVDLVAGKLYPASGGGSHNSLTKGYKTLTSK